MTTTAATSMISKNSTTAASLAAGAPTVLGGRRSSNYPSCDVNSGHNCVAAVVTKVEARVWLPPRPRLAMSETASLKLSPFAKSRHTECPALITPSLACGGTERPLLASASRNSVSGLAAAYGEVAMARRANTVVANPPIANFMIGPVHCGVPARQHSNYPHGGPKQLISEHFRSKS